MDMKKILQAIDNANTEVSSSEMQRLRNIVEGKGPLNRSTPAESIAMQHYAEPKKTITAPVLNVQEDARPSMIGKYFKAVEEELQESAQRGNLRTRQLAERVTTRLNELSTATLASYKKKAGVDAKKADAEGDFERGNKRFKGINKATIKQFDNDAKGVAEGSLNELAPSPGFGGDDDDDKYTPADYGKPFKANYLGQNKFEVFCRKPQDPSNVIKLNAEVQKYGLEWEDDFGFWFLDSPGAVYLSWKYGEIPLPKAIDQARNPGHIHDLVTDYLTNSPHAAEIQKIATEYFGFTADGEMNEGKK